VLRRDKNLENVANRVSGLVGSPIISSGGFEFGGIHSLQTYMHQEAGISGSAGFDTFDDFRATVLDADEIPIGVDGVSIRDHDRRAKGERFRWTVGNGAHAHALNFALLDEDPLHRGALQHFAA